MCFRFTIDFAVQTGQRNVDVLGVGLAKQLTATMTSKISRPEL